MVYPGGEWRPGSFTKNFSWGDKAEGLVRLHEIIRLGFDGKVEDVPRSEFRRRVKAANRPDYIPINFFLFNTNISGVDHLIADELVFQAITADHGPRFDKLALFAFNFSYVGRWNGATPHQRRPALWAHYYVKQRVADDLKWDAKRINADDIEQFVLKSPNYVAKTARKLATNLNYLYAVGRLSEFASASVERWWVDSLFLALDRIIEDKKLDKEKLPESKYTEALLRAHFPSISGAWSIEKTLASQHLVNLYIACGDRQRFSEDHVKELTQVRIPDIHWYLSNDDRPRGAVHPSNPRILKSIPRACALLARYLGGFDEITPDELENFDADEYIRTHTKTALDRLREKNVSPTMTAEELMKLTRK